MKHIVIAVADEGCPIPLMASRVVSALQVAKMEAKLGLGGGGCPALAELEAAHAGRSADDPPAARPMPGAEAVDEAERFLKNLGAVFQQIGDIAVSDEDEAEKLKRIAALSWQAEIEIDEALGIGDREVGG